MTSLIYANTAHRVIEVGATVHPKWATTILIVFAGLTIISSLVAFSSDDGTFILFGVICAIISFVPFIASAHSSKVKQDQIQVHAGNHTYWVNAHKLPDGVWWPDNLDPNH